ncbi:MAG: hypothetical protein AB1742_05635 [bacterium]
MDAKTFFSTPQHPLHRNYDALRFFFTTDATESEAAQAYGMTFHSFRTVKRDFLKFLKEMDPYYFFFKETKTGPKGRRVPADVVDMITALREKELSVPDIKVALDAHGVCLSYGTIDNILKDCGFARLERRGRRLREAGAAAGVCEPPQSEVIDWENLEPVEFASRGVGLFLFTGILKRLDVMNLVREARYPGTSALPALNMILSFLTLKLSDNERLSHVDEVSLDRGFGLFAVLNALPKTAALSGYSWRVTTGMNRRFTKALCRAALPLLPCGGDVNLDFTAIPHWGDESTLENNWSGKRGKALKSVLALLAQDADTGLLVYGDAGVLHRDESDGVLEFVDFYRETGAPVNCLIFDSKVTTYKNLSRLNGDGIKFITIRRHSKSLDRQIATLPDESWQGVDLGSEFKRKYRSLKAHDSLVTLRNYEGQLRQIVIKDHGRERPSIIITNVLDAKLTQLLRRYGRRWLIEKEIAEQIDFFHLNRLSSSIVVKVDFDLAMTIFAHTCYLLLGRHVKGFEKATARQMYRKFVSNLGRVRLDNKNIEVVLNKKAHLPLLHNAGLIGNYGNVPWLNNCNLTISIGTSL